MGEEIDMAYSDRELLARLIECEAGGEGENGMKAVASVVMNRVRSTGGEYARVGQGSIRKIIMQPGQFVCASETERGAYNPQNIDINWDIQLDYALTGWLTANLYVNMIYDDDILFGKTADTPGSPRLQIKEVLGIGFQVNF